MYKIKNVRQLSFKMVILSLVLSILIWTIVTNAWGYTNYLNIASHSWASYIFAFFSRLLWSVPAIVLLVRYKHDVPVTFEQLFTNMPQVKPLMGAVTIISLYNLAAMFYNHGGLWINPYFHFAKHFSMFLMVAFAEELVYRGWGLNALSAFVPEKIANAIAVIFFIILHLPAYFIRYFLYGTFPMQAVAVQCAYVLVLGLFFGYLYCKGKSLWSCMLAHFLADFMGVMIVG